MDDLSQFEHLQNFLNLITEETPCGEDLDSQGDEDYMRIEREIEQADESREWNELKKDIEKLLTTTKDFRLVARFGRTLLQTETTPIAGLVQGLYLAKEYIEKYWDCVYPPEDKDDPDEKFADRINALAELGSWPSIVLQLRKKCPLLSFEGMEDYFLEDLIAFQKGEIVENKQPLGELIGALSPEEKKQIDTVLNSFNSALQLAEEIKKLMLEKTEMVFVDFDAYLLPNLQEGVSILSGHSPNSKKITSDSNTQHDDPNNSSNENSPKTSNSIGSIQSRDDVVKLLDMISDYYRVNEPSSPLPLLLQRARSIVHKDFLEVLEELVPDSVSMTEPVFGRKEDEEEY